MDTPAYIATLEQQIEQLQSKLAQTQKALEVVTTRPLLGDADLRLELRMCGESTNSFEVSSDEGDGIEFHSPNDKYILPQCYENWISQLRVIVYRLELIRDVAKDHEKG